jgi:hypothetical protein
MVYRPIALLHWGKNKFIGFFLSRHALKRALCVLIEKLLVSRIVKRFSHYCAYEMPSLGHFRSHFNQINNLWYRPPRSHLCSHLLLLILICLLTAIGLSPCGSSAVHINTQIIHRTTQITTNVEESGPCPFFASFTLALALQLRIKARKTSVRIRKTSVSVQSTESEFWDLGGAV